MLPSAWGQSDVLARCGEDWPVWVDLPWVASPSTAVSRSHAFEILVGPALQRAVWSERPHQTGIILRCLWLLTALWASCLRMTVVPGRPCSLVDSLSVSAVLRDRKEGWSWMPSGERCCRLSSPPDALFLTGDNVRRPVCRRSHAHLKSGPTSTTHSAPPLRKIHLRGTVRLPPSFVCRLYHLCQACI